MIKHIIHVGKFLVSACLAHGDGIPDRAEVKQFWERQE
jgi:hypothetical protein